MASIPENDTVGAVAVAGAGIAGVQAALDLAESGFKVYLLEPSGAIGGTLAQRDTSAPSGDCPICLLTPRLVACARNRNIDIITLADITAVTGRPGNFKIKVRRNPRYVDLKQCDACGECSDACPVVLPVAPEDPAAPEGMEARKAIARAYPQAIPNVFSIAKAAGQAACKTGCPAGVNVQGFLALLRAGKTGAAYALLRQQCPLPASSGRICRRECEAKCRRAEIDEAVSIRDLERFVADAAWSDGALPLPETAAGHGQGARIAIVGGGPAGLTAASDLAARGYSVTLFEAHTQLGGMLRYGIPAFRLPKDVLQREIGALLQLGVEVHTDTRIADPKALLTPGVPSASGVPSSGERAALDPFQAVFLATGAWEPRKLGIPGENARGVWQAVNFLYVANAGTFPPIGPEVVVLGGSDLALDAARCALRLPGVQRVHLACLESWAEMPADPGLVDAACKEGVIVHNGVGPTRIEKAGNRAAAVCFRACTSVYDEHRRFDPIFDDAAMSRIPADTVIVAAGRLSDAAGFGLDMRPGGRILADARTAATGVPGLYAGGDAVLGPASMADAIAQGHRAAAGIDAYVRGGASLRSAGSLSVPAPGVFRPHAAHMAANPNPGAPFQERVRMPQADRSGRPGFMQEVSLGYGREQAAAESARCLSCGFCSECMQCVQACTAGAIRHDEQPSEMEIAAGSLIVAPGAGDVPASGPGIHRILDIREPEDVAQSILQASAAAAEAMRPLASVRGTLTQRREYPWERDVSDEAPRIGVFVCRCGRHIASVVDVERVVRKAARMPGVQYAEAAEYACSDANQQRIGAMIRRHRLNRLVVASCSSRTHEVLFQETLRESGLNAYLLAMTNIRDECSWVHREDAAAATAKAIDLVAMAVARARRLRALPLTELPVTPAALVLGGGLAGMTAAEHLAGQGFRVHLVEPTDSLGGRPRTRLGVPEAPAAPENLAAGNPAVPEDPAADLLPALIEKIQAHPRIRVYRNAEFSGISGQAGDFTSRLQVAGEAVALDHAVVIVATDGQERATDAFLHGQHACVVTQSRLASMLAGEEPLPEMAHSRKPLVVMLQCVESRDAGHPYCSRICCWEAVRNALEIRRLWPASEVVIVGGQPPEYGPYTALRAQALEQGVRFISHADTHCPEVAEVAEVAGEQGRLRVQVLDAAVNRRLVLHPDLLVLSTGMEPAPENAPIARLLRAPLTAEGFFAPAHSALRPVDLINEGEFFCGWAHSPMFAEEAQAQARAAAARATAILSRPKLEILGRIARVDPAGCVACTTCVQVCPYGAPRINEVRKSEIQGTRCLGCGSCVAACPSRAIVLQQQEDPTVVAMLDELLIGGGAR